MSFFALLTGRVVSFFGGEATITGQPTLGPICDCGGNCNDNENCAIHSCSGDTYDECTSPTDSFQLH